MLPIIQATLQDVEKLIPALLELRTNRTQEELYQMIQQQMQEEFYFVYIGDEKMAYCVSGFRIMNMLHSGKTLYIDDLVTHSAHRKKGYAKQLLQWIEHFAKTHKCVNVSLDSGFHRTDAYRVYLNFGFNVASLHFNKKL